MPSLDETAEWFLRLNGFFTVLNFVVHPVKATEGSRQRTDADVMGMRLQYRKEIVGGKSLIDHPEFEGSPRAIVVIGEVKAGPCNLNGPWTREADGNVGNVLSALGCVPPEVRASISRSLYTEGRFESKELEARLLCFGARKSDGLPIGTLQLTWKDVFTFVHDRYQAYWRAKRQNQQWPPIGRLLWERSRNRQRDVYVQEMLAVFGVGTE